ARIELPLRDDYEIGFLPLIGAFELNGETFSPDEFAYLGMKNNSIGFNGAPPINNPRLPFCAFNPIE
ncbi:hypothetical protein RF043_17795, partial [Serratia marcescens]|nr:hypothetical protein [Serratia marcescens]